MTPAVNMKVIASNKLDPSINKLGEYIRSKN
jgi:hypothetical protein